MKGKNVPVVTDRERGEIAKLLEERRRLMGGRIDDAVARRIVAINQRLRVLGAESGAKRRRYRR
jgi:hypothetical protein